jgi:hypothetical protein
MRISIPILTLADPVSYQKRELEACGPKEKQVVLRPSTTIGNHLQTKLAVDGDWEGVKRAAGKTYYLEQSAHFIGANRVNNDLGVMDDAEGQKELAKPTRALGRSSSRRKDNPVCAERC